MDELFGVDGNFYGRDTKRIPRPWAFPRLSLRQAVDPRYFSASCLFPLPREPALPVQ